MLIVLHRYLFWDFHGMPFDTVFMQLVTRQAECRFPKERFYLYMASFLKMFIVNKNLSFVCVCMFSNA